MGEVEVVAFDLMDTLLRDPFREAIEAGFGVPLRELAVAGLPRVWPQFEAGLLSEADYWQAYRDAGHDVDPAAFHAARRGGYAWIDGMRELVVDLAAAGTRLVIASNYPAWIQEVHREWLGDHFERVVASHAVGARKPQRDFYAALLAEVAVPARAVVLVDDRPANVDAAREHGLRAELFTSATRLRRRLRALGLPVT